MIVKISLKLYHNRALLDCFGQDPGGNVLFSAGRTIYLSRSGIGHD